MEWPFASLSLQPIVALFLCVRYIDWNVQSLFCRLRLSRHDDKCSRVSGREDCRGGSCARYCYSPLPPTSGWKGDLDEPDWCVKLACLLCLCNVFLMMFLRAFSLHLCLDSRSLAPSQTGQQQRLVPFCRRTRESLRGDDRVGRDDEGPGWLHQRHRQVGPHLIKTSCKIFTNYYTPFSLASSARTTTTRSSFWTNSVKIWKPSCRHDNQCTSCDVTCRSSMHYDFKLGISTLLHVL